MHRATNMPPATATATTAPSRPPWAAKATVEMRRLVATAAIKEDYSILAVGFAIVR
jgi:hypothetical protein